MCASVTSNADLGKPAIPSYADLGKAARDLFCKGFNYGTYQIDLKTKIASDMELLTSGSDHHDTGVVTGSMELKSTVWKDMGLSWSTKWSLENMVSAEVAVEDKLLQGLKLSCDGQFVPLTGKKNATVRAVYKNSLMHTNIAADVAGPNISGSLVLGHKGWLAGCHLSYDTCRATVTNFNMAAARTMADYTIYLAFNNSTQFHSSIYHKVNDKLELGIKKGWSTDKTDTKFSVAAKYSVDKDLVLRGKLNNRCQIGLSYQQRVHDAVTLTLSALIEGKRLNQPCHKFGIGLEFEF